ncbi:hypothetical protein [Lactococcus garvieae]|uniref:Uncharacterized protein n=1 Tax=Lactococcus garvieae TaxID=1363 RepID=A0A1I4HB18_9LACT|nr:hypothetical protein [Lactococcus garvieae]SFL39482.1 hypothetical protein SAMN05216438_10810 [Lactococcus garvieae]
MKQSGVTFDFESFVKQSAGAGGIILIPTIHLSKGGDVTLYCLKDEEKYHQFRIAKSGEKVGIELLEKEEHNSYSLGKRPSGLAGRISCLSKYLELDLFLGTDFYSGNFPLYQQSENVWWFDLKEAHSKRKALKRELKKQIKALRG